ncbi:MAG: hypothetical protein OEZ13_05165 [Spirochaetia bacterium]|nr:hypothetical protein [Spirochaetia bacterium]
MGRTVMPYSMALEKTIARFKNYRRALRKEDRDIFDELMRAAKKQIQSGAMAQNPNAFDSMSMAMLIEIKKTLDDYCKKVDFLIEKNNPSK